MEDQYGCTLDQLMDVKTSDTAGIRATVSDVT
jgi:hypothetical protein